MQNPPPTFLTAENGDGGDAENGISPSFEFMLVHNLMSKCSDISSVALLVSYPKSDLNFAAGSFSRASKNSLKSFISRLAWFGM